MKVSFQQGSNYLNQLTGEERSTETYLILLHKITIVLSLFEHQFLTQQFFLMDTVNSNFIENTHKVRPYLFHHFGLEISYVDLVDHWGLIVLINKVYKVRIWCTSSVGIDKYFVRCKSYKLFKYLKLTIWTKTTFLQIGLFRKKAIPIPKQVISSKQPNLFNPCSRSEYVFKQAWHYDNTVLYTSSKYVYTVLYS